MDSFRLIESNQQPTNNHQQANRNQRKAPFHSTRPFGDSFWNVTPLKINDERNLRITQLKRKFN